MPTPTSDLHALFVTHTHERIARTLLAMHTQQLAPATITVSCDSDDERIQPEIQRAADMLNREITLTLRSRNPQGCRSQNRNNAVRALLKQSISDSAKLVFYDGDCIACPQSNAVHSRALDHFDLSLGSAIMLSPEQTDTLTDEQTLQGRTHTLLDDAQRRASAKAHRQTRKRILLKKIKLTKPHKPGILSGNFAIRLSTFRTINGFDESFTGWGMEDDDLARRAYMSNARPTSSMDKAIVLHQHHLTESPKNWKDSPNAHRLDQPTTMRCSLGLDNPATQHDPQIITITPNEARQPIPQETLR